MHSVLNEVLVKYTFNSGVYLSLSGTVYANNSVILITEIGETTSNTGLQCFTDRSPCCTTLANRFGQWYFPDNMLVPVLGAGANRATTFYRTRGDDGSVNLNRVSSDVMMPTGLFCCVVPDATDTMRRVCTNIGELIMCIAKHSSYS